MAFPSNALESALAGLRAGTGSPDGLLQALAENELWVPLPAGAPEGDQSAQLPIMVLDDGQPYVAVYSSAEQFGRGAGDQAHMVLRGRELAAMMAESLGVAVNAGAEAGLPVRAEGVAALRGGRRTAPAGQRVRLGHPAEEPSALLEALRSEFAREGTVGEARRGLAQIGDAAPGLVIGVGCAAGARHAVLAAVSRAAQAAPAGLAVDTVFLDDGDAISRWLLTNAEPFYRR
jgi:hypothetical protein